MASCGTERMEGFGQRSRKAKWIAKDAAKKRASGLFEGSTIVCYFTNVPRGKFAVAMAAIREIISTE